MGWKLRGRTNAAPSSAFCVKMNFKHTGRDSPRAEQHKTLSKRHLTVLAKRVKRDPASSASTGFQLITKYPRLAPIN
jgi:hypothetical protein